MLKCNRTKIMKQKNKESSDVMKIAAYCRVSTEKEAQIDSLEKQIEFFNEFTKKNGYELYKLYADEGISGKQIKHRKQFQQMMIDAKAKKFDKVVVKDVSRFARNTVDLLQSVRELKSYGVQVDFLNNGEVMEGGSEFILTILGAMAQQESANMSKRVKFGKDITAKKGRVPNLVFGYDKIPDERYTLKINEEEAKIVKEIFESYVYKGIGTTKIAWNLNDRGIRTKKTKSKWVQTSIVRMLKNPIYTGRVTNKKSEVTDFITGTRKELPEEEWIVVERPEMRIISDELFNRAQELLEQRSNEFKLNNKREKTEYVFSTLIYCKHCGYSFRRIKRKYTADGPEYIRWVCSGRNSMGVNHCPNTTVIDEEELLNAIKIYLKSIIKNKKDFMKALHTKSAPAAIGPYSQAIEVNGFVFASGQIPIDPATGEFVEGGIKEQTRQALTNGAHIMAEAGIDLSHVVKTTVFLADMADFAAMNEVYSTFFKEPFPARSAVAVKALPKGALVEVECVAVK